MDFRAYLNNKDLSCDHYVEKKYGGKFCFAKVSAEFCRRFFPRRSKKTTKYDLKTFNGREQNLNSILIINLLLLHGCC
jgi:hypothetical protein